ncbi:hypothetical protein AB0L32_09590 [Micrococcus luteus]
MAAFPALSDCVLDHTAEADADIVMCGGGCDGVETEPGGCAEAKSIGV